MTTSMRPPATDTAPAGARHPMARLGRLLDPGSLTALHDPDDGSGVLAVEGRVAGRRIFAYCTDATRMGGALGAHGCRSVVAAIEAAVRHRAPVVGLWHSGGARLADGVESMDGVGRMFAAMTRASGVVPQISVVLGPAAGAAAYGPALTDLVVVAGDGRLFVTGPDVVRSVTGEVTDMETLGGPGTHASRSGVAHVTTGTEVEALDRARDLVGYFVRPGRFDVHDPSLDCDLEDILPPSRRRAYDVRTLVRAMADRDSFLELQSRWAPNVVVGFGRLGGRAVGFVANNPIRKGGCLDSLSAEKAARFVRMCDGQGVPLVVVVDVPGYLPGIHQEWEGVVRRGAKLLHAFAEATVPRVTLVTRKAYGGAYVAMNSRSLGATAVFAWPGAEVAVMSADAAVGVLHRRTLAAAPDHTRADLRRELAAEHARTAGGVERAIDLGLVDEVIEPAKTRRRLVAVLAEAPAGRGGHGNIPL